MRLYAGLLILCISMLVSSCTQPRYVYSPPVRNLHYFQKAGQSKLAAHWATGPSRNDGGTSDTYNHGFDLQAAYAVSDHWALMKSYYNRKESDNINSFGSSNILYSEIDYKRNGSEFGASFFTPFSKGSESFFHIDGGVGFAKNSLLDKGTFDSLGLTRNYSDKMFRVFFQPGIYTVLDAFQFGLGARVQWQFFNNVQTDYRPAELAAYSLSGLNQLFNLEPYFSIRYGPPSVPWLKGEVQTGFTTVDKGYYVRGGFFSIGVAVDPFFRGTQRHGD